MIGSDRYVVNRLPPLFFDIMLLIKWRLCMARYNLEHKEQTRERIITAAGRCFKKSGFSGIGVDGLAKEAGVTSGAFYGHFNSKNTAFSTVVETGMGELLSGIHKFKEQYGGSWWPEFAEFYMTQKRICDLSEGCVLQTLTSEVGRADESIQVLFESELLKIVQAVTDRNDQESIDKTWVRLAMLVGGVTLSRAVNDEKLSNEIAMAVKSTVSN
jgi:TetR/AcrR family transcriptional repressor of nem operon